VRADGGIRQEREVQGFVSTFGGLGSREWFYWRIAHIPYRFGRIDMCASPDPQLRAAQVTGQSRGGRKRVVAPDD
jgi:hypothetical protein